MSQFQIKCLKKKVRELEQEIADRTRNFLLKYQTKFHSTPSSHLSTTSNSSQSFHHITPQNEPQLLTNHINKWTSNSQHKMDHQMDIVEGQKEQWEEGEMVGEKRLSYGEIRMMLVREREEKEGLKSQMMRMSIEIEKFRQKYETEERENSEMLEELQLILKQTEKVEKEFRSCKMGLEKREAELKEVKQEYHKMFKSYESMRIIEYELNQTISELNQKHQLHIQECIKRKQILSSELKITKAEKSDLEISYLQAQSNLTQLSRQLQILNHQNTTLSQSYNQSENKRKEYERKAEGVVGKLARGIVRGLGLTEMLPGIEQYMEEIKKGEQIGQYISYLMNI